MSLKLISADDHIVNDEEIIAEKFNIYFVNVGKTMADAVVPSLASDFNLTAANKNNNSLFVTPSCPQEVFNVIKKLKTKKAKRTVDVETMFIRNASPVTSKFLNEIFNICLSEGM